MEHTERDAFMKKTRVAVAMSGGVDSSVAALLLVQRGFDVVGLTMKLLVNPPSVAGPRPCCTLEMAQNAARVCQSLGIPHYTLNLVEEFEAEVILPFIQMYEKGETPNPCLMCNSSIKFGHLLRKAMEIDAEYLATGHYVRAGVVEDGKLLENHLRVEPGGEVQGSGRVLLFRGKDNSKDQSYALYGLTQDMLSRAMFPLGDFHKTQTREIAAKARLLTAETPESQEICFVTQGTYRDFLASRGIQTEPGLIMDTSGKVLGRHHGLSFYTIGQRKGLGVSAGHPLYVVEIDREKNLLIVGERNEAYSRGAHVKNVNIIAKEGLKTPEKGTCMVRYRGTEVPATMNPLGRPSEAYVEFDRPQFAVTKGQALVFYQGEMVFGGGLISQCVRT